VAIKQLMCLMMTPEHEDAAAEFCHESTIFAKLRHPNIIHFYGISFDGPSVYIVMELAHCSMTDYLLSSRKSGSRRQTGEVIRPL
jgi:serine/threonine protein kinase